MTDTPTPADQAPEPAAASAAETSVAPPAASPPDRLSTQPRSPYYNMDVLQRGIGIRFKGRQRHDVEEYCLSEGWIRVGAGKSKDRYGNPLTIKLSGEVEAWFEDLAAKADSEGDAG